MMDGFKQLKPANTTRRGFLKRILVSLFAFAPAAAGMLSSERKAHSYACFGPICSWHFFDRCNCDAQTLDHCWAQVCVDRDDPNQVCSFFMNCFPIGTCYCLPGSCNSPDLNAQTTC